MTQLTLARAGSGAVRQLKAANGARDAPARADVQVRDALRLKRRSALTGSFVTLLTSLPSVSSFADDFQIRRDSLLKDQSCRITQRVALEMAICGDGSGVTRTLGETRFCQDLTPVGSLTIGLFGDRLPVTVANFVKTVEAGAYDGTIVNRIVAGEFLAIGKQGSKRQGEVEAPTDLQSNPELASAKAFELPHVRAGTVSLAIAENDDPSERTLAGDYHPTQFLITTGPGPAPRLDNANVVFGCVEGGLDTLRQLAEVRTYKPSARVQAFNAFATAIGDERASEVRKSWSRPIQPIVVTHARVLMTSSSGSGEMTINSINRVL